MSKRRLIERTKKHLPDLSEFDQGLIEKAYDLGEKAHKGQKRASGLDYFKGHCVPVAEHIIDLEMDAILIAAALLHDTIEDTNITSQDIEQEFGAEIAGLVEGVSKLGKIKYRGNERHVESLRKFFISVAQDVRVVILKLADRWHNLETLGFLPPEKQQRIALESIMIHAPLASRLGMGKLVVVLNDLAFPFAYPEQYKKTKEIRDISRSRADATINKMYRDLTVELSKTLGYIPPIDKRVKGMFSLYRKLERKQWNIEEVYDIVALRIIVKNVPDCYLGLGAVHAHWRPVPGRVKDYIAAPKPNGYQSLHTVVFSGDGPIVELQIRTEEMHEFNEFGVASHHSYKNYGENTSESFEWLQQLRLFQNANVSPSDYLKRLRTDFFQDRIFTLSPKGDVIDLPVGATILDFAYAVHGQIGEHASGGTINGKFMALKSVLKNEDIVEIITSTKSHPTNKWLEYCITDRAIARIRHYIKNKSQ